MTNTDTAHPEYKTRERERENFHVQSATVTVTVQMQTFDILILREVVFVFDGE